ncbi:MAG: hypothetical protein ACFFFG_15330 [Candidatus Thorarchaeota archaeon]
MVTTKKGTTQKKSPGARSLRHSTKKKPSKGHCRICGAIIHLHRRKRTRSTRHAARPYGGELCHACLKTSIQLVST